MGKYDLIERSFRTMATDPTLDLRKAGIGDLLRIPGVGMKTARFFVLHSRPDTQAAVLDTHLRKHLKELGYEPPAFPPVSPLVYRVWEDTVLRLVDRAGLTPADYDLTAWMDHRRPPPAGRGSPAGRRARCPAR
jgi:thermostable 8-oxoguanine DNA glycosylase